MLSGQKHMSAACRYSGHNGLLIRCFCSVFESCTCLRSTALQFPVMRILGIYLDSKLKWSLSAVKSGVTDGLYHSVDKKHTGGHIC
jgi:hypothetical protein